MKLSFYIKNCYICTFPNAVEWILLSPKLSRFTQTITVETVRASTNSSSASVTSSTPLLYTTSNEEVFRPFDIVGKVPEGQRRHQVTLLQSLSRHNQLGWQGSINRFDTVRRTRPNTGGDGRGLTTTSHFTTADSTSTELVAVQLVEWSVVSRASVS